MPNSAISFNTAGLASATSPGLVGTGAQTFAGKKTLDGGALIKGDTSGVAIASGYVGEVFPAVLTTLTNQTQGVWKTGNGITVQGGFYFVKVTLNVAFIAPVLIYAGITTTVNGTPSVDALSISTQVSVLGTSNTVDALTAYTYGYFRVSSTTTIYPTGQAVKPSGTTYSYDFTIAAVRIA